MFDQEHSAPKRLEKFVKPFGKLNDAIVAADKDSIKKYAQKVLEARSKVGDKRDSQSICEHK